MIEGKNHLSMQFWVNFCPFLIAFRLPFDPEYYDSRSLQFMRRFKTFLLKESLTSQERYTSQK